MWRKLMLTVLGVILAASFSACAVEIGIGDDCLDDFDCPAGTFCDPDLLVCAEEVIVAECEVVEDCAEGACDDDGTCQIIACEIDEDCPLDGSICDPVDLICE